MRRKGATPPSLMSEHLVPRMPMHRRGGGREEEGGKQEEGKRVRPGSYYERCGAAPGGCRVTGSPVGEPPLTTPRRWTLPPKLGAVRGADIKN